MAAKENNLSSNTLLILSSSIIATAFGAYHLGKASYSKSNSSSSTMLNLGKSLTSLLSLTLLPASYSFAPTNSNNVKQIQNHKLLASSGNDETTPENYTKDEYDRRDQPDESLSQSITMQPVGHVSSVYRLCVGTPRQGLLAPNSRGRIDLYPSRIASDSVLSLDSFSHVWVMFIFHLNTTSQKHTKDNGIANKRQFPSKIKPPALGGKKIGIFATRSPHRPNQIGFR
jgi:tRNA (Thr-GGU) A37 N-methylase